MSPEVRLFITAWSMLVFLLITWLPVVAFVLGLSGFVALLFYTWVINIESRWGRYGDSER